MDAEAMYILDIFSTIELYSKFADQESYVKAG